MVRKGEQKQKPPKVVKRASKQNKDKGNASTSDDQHLENTAAPWPRADKKLFEGVGRERMAKDEVTCLTSYISRKHTDPWALHNSICYNGLVRLQIKPTKFICDETTQRMGILDEVKQMWKRMGLGTLGYQSDTLYPELVRQFLASAELRYENEALPVASQGMLSYLSSGVLYEISIHELCVLYGFETCHESCSLPTFDDAKLLWDQIGSRSYMSGKSKLTLIRNPVLRVVTKYLGHLIWGKDETNALKADELLLIHYGLPPELRRVYPRPLPSELTINMGVLFANMLVGRKFRGLKAATKKTEQIGSLLTKIFKFHEIDLSKTEKNEERLAFDEKHFMKCEILRSGLIYQYTVAGDIYQHCKLPQPDITALTSHESMTFLPPPELRYIFPASAPPPKKHRGGSSVSDPAQRQSEDCCVLPAYTGQFDFPPPPLDGTPQEQFAWTADSQMKLLKMMQQMWGAFASSRVPPPPLAPSASVPSDMSTETTTEIPDVVGHRDTDTAVAEGAAEGAADMERDARLPRRRREPGQSRSCSPNDHH